MFLSLHIFVLLQSQLLLAPPMNVIVVTEVDHRMRSGHRIVVVISGGNFSCFSRSTLIFLSHPPLHVDLCWVDVLCFGSLFAEVYHWFRGWPAGPIDFKPAFLQHLCQFSVHLVVRHLYRPCVIVGLVLVRMYCRLGF